MDVKYFFFMNNNILSANRLNFTSDHLTKCMVIRYFLVENNLLNFLSLKLQMFFFFFAFSNSYTILIFIMLNPSPTYNSVELR